MKQIVIISLISIAGMKAYTQNVGIGTAAPAQKLDVVGNIKLSGAIMPGGAAGTAGQVLTTNGGNNAATWKNASINTGFAASIVTFQTIPNNTVTALDFNSEETDDGGNFNIAANEYTAPTDGFYH